MAHKINELNIPIIGTVDTLSIQINPFPLFPATIQAYYVLTGPEASLNGNITIPEDVVALWGTDDTVVLDYIAGQLGLTVISEVE